MRIQDAALIAAATLSHRYVTNRFLPDKAIDLIDEAASRLRIEIDSMPTELDVVTRRMRQLEIERMALVEGDRRRVQGAPRAPRGRARASCEEQADAMAAAWQAEKAAITRDPRRRSPPLEERRVEAERLEREGDLERAAQLRYGELPTLEREIDDGDRPRSPSSSATMRS